MISSLEETSPSSDQSSPTLSSPDLTVTVRQQAATSACESLGALSPHHSPTNLTCPIKPTSKMEGIVESVPTFHGKRDGYEDPTEYLETIAFVVEEKYAEPGKAATVKRLVFRSRLRGEALTWYQRLESTVRGDWTRLSELFAAEYKLEPRSGPDPNHFFNQLYNLKQGKKPIAQYVAEAEDLYRKCPDALKAYMGNQFVAGIADDAKLDMVQLYLSQENEITFPLAKAAVVKAYTRIGRASPFDAGAMQPAPAKQEATQGEVNAELLDFFRGLRMAQPQISMSTQPMAHSYPQSQQPPPAGGYQRPQREGQANASRYPPGSLSDVICHNCMEHGHFSSSCPQPQVSFREKAINRAKAEEMQGQGRPAPMPQQPQAAPAAVAQQYQESSSPKGRGPLTECSGNVGRTSAPLPMTPAILRRGQSLDGWQQGSKVAMATKPKVRFDLQDESKSVADANVAPASKVVKLPSKATRQEARKAVQKVAERAVYGRPRNPGTVQEMPDEDPSEAQSGSEDKAPRERSTSLPPARIHASVEEVRDEQQSTPQPRGVNQEVMDIQMTDPEGSRRDTSAETWNPSPNAFIPKPTRHNTSKVPEVGRGVESIYTDPRAPRAQYGGPRETIAINMA